MSRCEMTRVNGARCTEATLTLTLRSSWAYPPDHAALDFQVKCKAMAGNPEFMFLFNRQL